MQPVPPLQIALRPSQYGRFALMVIHGLALMAVWAATLPWLLAVASVGLVAGSLWRLRYRITPEALILHGDGRLKKVGVGGTAVDVELLSETTAIGPLIVLCFRHAGKFQSQVVLPDSVMAADDFRRLKRWLRWQVGEKSV
jgi:hypothetical protein